MTAFRYPAPLLLALVALGAAAGPPDPATIKDKVTITVGKTLLVQFEQKGDTISQPKVVEKADDKAFTPSFEFIESSGNLTLTTRNPFPKDLKFRALARIKGRKTYFETSIVPVRSGILGIELWPDPIEELILFDFKLEKAK